MKIHEIIREDFKVTQSNAQGMELTSPDGVKMTLPADKAAAIQSDPTNPNKFKLDPQSIQQSNDNQNKPIGPQVGSEIEIPDDLPAFESLVTDPDLISSKRNSDVGGDPADDYIDDIVDHDFEKHASRNSRELNYIKQLSGL
jgi:hypothetical protein